MIPKVIYILDNDRLYRIVYPFASIFYNNGYLLNELVEGGDTCEIITISDDEEFWYGCIFGILEWFDEL
jgi:hypothetical protein